MGKLTTIDFHNDTIFAMERDDGVFVAIAPICRSLGLDVRSQRDRIQRDQILNEGGVMMTLPSPGGMQESLCLRLDLLNGWLFGIDESRIKDEEIRQKVLVYKREGYQVLYRHFIGSSVNAAVNQDAMTPESILAQATVSERLRMVSESRETWGPGSSQQVWVKVNLPVVPLMVAREPAPAPQGDLFEPK
jgi:antirepressor protein